MARSRGPSDPLASREPVVVLTAIEVAELLRVDRKTIYDAAQRGLIPHRRLGRRLLFEREAVLAWLRQRDVDTT
jgi:excisionase family DNA binding protein